MEKAPETQNVPTTEEEKTTVTEESGAKDTTTAPKKSGLISSFQKSMAMGVGAVFEEQQQTLKAQEQKPAKVEIVYDTKIPQRLSVQTVLNMFEKVQSLASEGFKKITINNRKERRAVKDDEEKYITACAKYGQDNQELIVITQRKVCLDSGIPDDLFDKSVYSYMMEGNMEVLERVQGFSGDIQESVTSVQDLTIDKDTIKKILESHLDYTVKNKTKLKDLAKTMPPPIAVQVVQFKVMDYIHEKFSIEDEDLQQAKEKGLLEDPEIKHIQEQLEEETIDILNSIAPPDAF